jgi:F0F1-type ATP synthase assembly protein I
VPLTSENARRGALTGPTGGRYTPPDPMAERPDPNQHLWGGMSTGWAISGTLLSGILAWGGIGYLIDWLAGTPKVFTAVGMVVGAVSAIYLVYITYGRETGERDGANRRS